MGKSVNNTRKGQGKQYARPTLNFFNDVETTGLSKKWSEVIAIGYEVRDFSNNLVKKDYLTIKAKTKWVIDKWYEPSSDGRKTHYEIHGLRHEELEYEPIDAAKKILRDLYDLKAHLNFVCHHGSYFDRNFMEIFFRGVGLHGWFNSLMRRPLDPMNDEPELEEQFYIEDTVKIAKRVGFPEANLKYLANYFELELDHHNAESDTCVLAEIYPKLKEIEANGLVEKELSQGLLI
jgi:DNA polymerase III epsilon subunit-like protein